MLNSRQKLRFRVQSQGARPSHELWTLVAQAHAALDDVRAQLVAAQQLGESAKEEVNPES